MFHSLKLRGQMHFQLEKFSNIFDEALPLFKDHHDEVGRYFDDIEFNPDVESYIKLDEVGTLRVFTIRESSEKPLIGYCIHHVHNHLHFCNSKQAIQDAIFIAPDYRGIGKEFINWVDEQLKSEGVDAVYHYVSKYHDYAKTLLKLNYEYIESTYLRRLH